MRLQSLKKIQRVTDHIVYITYEDDEFCWKLGMCAIFCKNKLVIGAGSTATTFVTKFYAIFRLLH